MSFFRIPSRGTGKASAGDRGPYLSDSVPPRILATVKFSIFLGRLLVTSVRFLTRPSRLQTRPFLRGRAGRSPCPFCTPDHQTCAHSVPVGCSREIEHNSLYDNNLCASCDTRFNHSRSYPLGDSLQMACCGITHWAHARAQRVRAARPRRRPQRSQNTLLGTIAGVSMFLTGKRPREAVALRQTIFT